MCLTLFFFRSAPSRRSGSSSDTSASASCSAWGCPLLAHPPPSGMPSSCSLLLQGPVLPGELCCLPGVACHLGGLCRRPRPDRGGGFRLWRLLCSGCCGRCWGGPSSGVGSCEWSPAGLVPGVFGSPGFSASVSVRGGPVLRSDFRPLRPTTGRLSGVLLALLASLVTGRLVDVLARLLGRPSSPSGSHSSEGKVRRVAAPGASGLPPGTDAVRRALVIAAVLRLRCRAPPTRLWFPPRPRAAGGSGPGLGEVRALFALRHRILPSPASPRRPRLCLRGSLTAGGGGFSPPAPVGGVWRGPCGSGGVPPYAPLVYDSSPVGFAVGRGGRASAVSRSSSLRFRICLPGGFSMGARPWRLLGGRRGWVGEFCDVALPLFSRGAFVLLPFHGSAGRRGCGVAPRLPLSLGDVRGFFSSFRSVAACSGVLLAFPLRARQ